MTLFQACKSLLIGGLLLSASSLQAQVDSAALTDGNTQVDPDAAVTKSWKNSLVVDGVFDRKPHNSAPLNWQPVREADIMWKKRVWREIDVREKQNMAFRYPGDENTGGGYFIEILMDAIKKGKLKAYSPNDDRFTAAMEGDQIREILEGKADTQETVDPVTQQVKLIVTHRDFDPDAITKYRVKEDVIFDRNLGRSKVRIIGIAPVTDVIDPNTGDVRGQAPMFWLYYPQTREVLAQYEVYNPENDVQRLTWDDFFEGRFFSSHITKVSNATGEFISQMPGMNIPLEALYEGQRQEEVLFNKEHDMWVY